MRIVVDTSALLAILLQEPERERFLTALLDNEPIISIATLIETYLVLFGRRGAAALDELARQIASYRFEIVLRELNERVRLPNEGAIVARSQLFILEEGRDYMVDEGRAAVLTEQGFERLVSAHRKGFEVVIMVDDEVAFALPAEVT